MGAEKGMSPNMGMGTKTAMNDRRRGALIGLAVGDALGAAVEFKRPGSFAPIANYRGGGPHGLSTGEWTDDTSMALALADSIAKVGWDLNDRASRCVEWWKTGMYSVNGRCFDIGMATRSALASFAATKDAFSSGLRSENASGNGSIMRLMTDDEVAATRNGADVPLMVLPPEKTLF